MSKFKILVAGGCHVEGWLVGKENSFATVLSRKLQHENIPNEIILVPYAIIPKVNNLVEICDYEKPDILILQYGNYEFSPSLMNQIRKKLRSLKASYQTSSSLKKPSQSQPIKQTFKDSDIKEKTFMPSTRYKASQVVKDIANKLIFYSWLNKLKWNNLTDNAFQQIYALHIPKVVVLSPFPSSNIVTNKYRKQGSAILKAQANKYNFQFINVFANFNKQLPKQILTIDEMHLNVNSHLVVGSSICTEIAGELKFLLRKKIVHQEINSYRK